MKGKYTQLMNECLQGIVHMRSQFEVGRLCLVLGAGFSEPLGFHLWKDLLAALEMKIFEDVEAESHLPDVAQPYRAQLLHETFAKKFFQSQVYSDFDWAKKLKFEQFEWRHLVNSCIYHKKTSENWAAHPYLANAFKIIENSEMTITFNFDDILERYFYYRRKTSNDFRATWGNNIQLTTGTHLIYHPNGYLPRDLSKTHSNEIVFMENSFVDSVNGSNSGKSSILLNHFLRNTCLLVGLSLDDPFLKSLLRHMQIINPAHVLYYIYFLEPGKQLSQDSRDAIRRTNFSVYNLITLFLEELQISHLFELLVLDENDFDVELRHRDKDGKFVYYLTGAVSVGKTTTHGHFHSLIQIKEWVDDHKPDLGKPADTLSEDDRTSVDSWLDDQWCKKNNLLIISKAGVYIVDRCPVDAFPFTPPCQWNIRAANFLDNVCGKKKIVGNEGREARPSQIQRGHVILLIAPVKDIVTRDIGRGRQSTMNKPRSEQNKVEKYYAKQQNGFLTIYCPCGDQNPISSGNVKLPTEYCTCFKRREESASKRPSCSSVTVIDTAGLTIPDLIQRIADIVHLEPYAPCDLGAWLEELAVSGFPSDAMDASRHISQASDLRG